MGTRRRYSAVPVEVSYSGAARPVLPALTDVAGPGISIRSMNAFALLHLGQPTFTDVRRIAKNTVDRVLAVLALIVLSPRTDAHALEKSGNRDASVGPPYCSYLALDSCYQP